jgi:hypothetical protein
MDVILRLCIANVVGERICKELAVSYMEVEAAMRMGCYKGGESKVGRGLRQESYH